MCVRVSAAAGLCIVQCCFWLVEHHLNAPRHFADAATEERRYKSPIFPRIREKRGFYIFSLYSNPSSYTATHSPIPHPQKTRLLSQQVCVCAVYAFVSRGGDQQQQQKPTAQRRHFSSSSSSLFPLFFNEGLLRWAVALHCWLDSSDLKRVRRRSATPHSTRSVSPFLARCQLCMRPSSFISCPFLHFYFPFLLSPGNNWQITIGFLC